MKKLPVVTWLGTLTAIMKHVHLYLWALAAALVYVPTGSAHADPLPEQVIRYGQSVDGRPLLAVVLGSGSNVTMILGGIHGNEPDAPAVVEDLKSFLEHHTALLNGNTVVLVAHVNPDGDSAGTRGNADGVDLNRNFPYNWAPRRRGMELSPGSTALSEPESTALSGLIKIWRPEKIVSIHQPFHCLLPSGPGGEALAHALAEDNGYPVKQDVGYPTPGSLGSYCYHTLGISATTLELPWTSKATAWRQNRDALIAAIQLPPPAESPANQAAKSASRE